MFDGLGEHLARLVEVVAGIEQAIDLRASRVHFSTL